MLLQACYSFLVFPGSLRGPGFYTGQSLDSRAYGWSGSLVFQHYKVIWQPSMPGLANTDRAHAPGSARHVDAFKKFFSSGFCIAGLCSAGLFPFSSEMGCVPSAAQKCPDLGRERNA